MNTDYFTIEEIKSLFHHTRFNDTEKDKRYNLREDFRTLIERFIQSENHNKIYVFNNRYDIFVVVQNSLNYWFTTSCNSYDVIVTYQF